MDPFAGYSIGISLVAIMIGVAGIILGIGYALNDRRIKEFGASELSQALISGAIMGAVFIAFSQSGFMTQIMNSITNSTTNQNCNGALGYNSAICFSYDYLAGSLSVNISNHTYPSLLTSTTLMLGGVSLLYTIVGTISSIEVGVDVGIIAEAGLTGLKGFLGPLEGAMEFLTLAFASILVQAALLKFVAYAAVQAILPVGLLLRVFYFTRRTGGMLIALAIGLFGVYPMSYVFGANLLVSFNSKINVAPLNSTIGLINSTLEGTGLINSTVSANSIKPGLIGSIIGTGQTIASALSSVLNLLINSVVALIMQVFILPAFCILLTITSIRELSKILGSEISLKHLDIF